jgi:hypothetical protein
MKGIVDPRPRHLERGRPDYTALHAVARKVTKIS